MKNLLFLVFPAFLSFPTFAATSGVLDGKNYCRTIVSDGMFGQPKGERQHCLSFKARKATDSANTFFGNAPVSEAYSVFGNRVEFGSSEYELSTDQSTLVTIMGSAATGTVFKMFFPFDQSNKKIDLASLQGKFRRINEGKCPVYIGIKYSKNTLRLSDENLQCVDCDRSREFLSVFASFSHIDQGQYTIRVSGTVMNAFSDGTSVVQTRKETDLLEETASLTVGSHDGRMTLEYRQNSHRDHTPLLENFCIFERAD